MLYIHTLKDLNPKSADIEAMPLVRQLRNTRLPLSEEKLKEQFAPFFLCEEDLTAGKKVLELISLAVQEIEDLPKAQPEMYEMIILNRTRNELKEIPPALQNSLTYAQGLLVRQNQLVSEIALLFNSLPSLKNKSLQEKLVYEDKIKNIFAEILRQKSGFFFNFADIINEAHTARTKSLAEIMEKKTFFRVKLEEYLKKMDFNDLSKRIPPEEIKKVEAIEQKIKDIKPVIEKIYDFNLQMVNLAIYIYAYIKCLK